MLVMVFLVLNSGPHLLDHRAHVRPGNLEDVFLELTGRELREE